MTPRTRNLLAVLVVLAALAAASQYVWYAIREPHRASAQQTAGRARRPVTLRLQRIGAAPSSRVLVDPTKASRMYAGGSVSNDGGQTWQPVIGSDARTVTPVGGVRYERPCTVGPTGNLLCAEVLYQAPGENGTPGLAGASEWTGVEWRTVVPPAEQLALLFFMESVSNNPEEPAKMTVEFQPLPPAMAVRAVAYLPDGKWAAATKLDVVTADGRRIQCPADVRDFVVGPDGLMYFAADRPTGIGAYVSNEGGESWLPVGGAERVVALASGAEAVYVAADRLGRGRGTSFKWTDWAQGFRAEHVAAHPSAPLVAAWGTLNAQRNLLMLSRDGGATVDHVTLPANVAVAWAAFDPSTTDSLLVVDRGNTLYRATIADAP